MIEIIQTNDLYDGLSDKINHDMYIIFVFMLCIYEAYVL